MKRHFSQRSITFLILGLGILFAGPTSCTYHHYRGLEKSSTTISIPDIFDSSFRKATYVTDFEVFGNELGGISIIKKVIPTNTYHVVFMSQIGLTYFDVEVAMDQDTGGFRVNYIMESLKRDFILTALQTDFELLFSKFPAGAQKQFYKHPEEKLMEMVVQYENTMSFYAADDSKVRSISQRKGNATRAAIHISDYGKNQPSQFKIHNRKARVQMSFREIDL
jgi:hypothetical protein